MPLQLDLRLPRRAPRFSRHCWAGSLQSLRIVPRRALPAVTLFSSRRDDRHPFRVDRLDHRVQRGREGSHRRGEGRGSAWISCRETRVRFSTGSRRTGVPRPIQLRGHKASSKNRELASQARGHRHRRLSSAVGLAPCVPGRRRDLRRLPPDQRSRSLGSRASRSASPNRLKPKTVSAIARPGKIAIHGAVEAYSSAPPCNIRPHAAVGSCTPSPR